MNCRAHEVKTAGKQLGGHVWNQTSDFGFTNQFFRPGGPAYKIRVSRNCPPQPIGPYKVDNGYLRQQDVHA